MITSDRQLPERAAKASDAVRVGPVSYCSCSSDRAYSASSSPFWRPLRLVHSVTRVFR